MKDCIKYIALLLMALPMLLFSCTHKEEPLPAGEDELTRVIPYRVTVEQDPQTRATLNGIDQYVFELGDELYITGVTDVGEIFGFLSLVAGEGASVATFEGELKCIGGAEPSSSTVLNATLVGVHDEMHTCANGKITGNTARALPKYVYATSFADAVQKYSEFTGTSTYGSHSFLLQQQMSFLIVSVAFDPAKLSSSSVSATLSNDNSIVLFSCSSVPVVNNGTEKQCDFVVSLPSTELEASSTLSNATLDFSVGETPVKDGSWNHISQTLVKNNYYTIDKTQFAVACFTIEAREDDTSITFNYTYASHGIQYSTDNGGSWNQYGAGDEIPLSAGGTIQVQGNASKIKDRGVLFNSNNPCYIYGDIMTLVWGVDYDPDTHSLVDSGSPNNRNLFEGLFKNNDYIDIPSGRPLILPGTTTNGCFKSMFEGCTSLTRTPELPASEVKTEAYRQMFKGCTGLTASPSLPATTVAENGYREMFMNCTSLISAPVRLSGTTTNNCCQSMFEGCSVLAIAPVLDAVSVGSYGYARMFCDCSSLLAAPDLPTETLEQACYAEMFRNCSSMASAPMILPASLLKYRCYYAMFLGCSSLSNAPVLPADNDVDPVPTECYRSMFYDCSSLNRLPEEYGGRPNLPLKKIGEYGCYYMFNGCTKLVEAPTLEHLEEVGDYGCQYMFRNCSELTTVPPVLYPTDVPRDAYREMFYGCPKITETPDIRAETMGMNACKQMFYGCTRLRTINGNLLPGTGSHSSEPLAESVYSGMFYGCTSLTTAPELAATNLGKECYRQMFQNSGITQAPDLPAATLVQQCYQEMFKGCTALKGTVYLPAGTLVQDCYDNMFEGASQFNSLICLATIRTVWDGDGGGGVNDLTPSCNDWLKNAKSTGTFYYASGFGVKGVFDPDRGWVYPSNSGIRNGWTYQEFHLDPIFPPDKPFNPEEDL